MTRRGARTGDDGEIQISAVTIFTEEGEELAVGSP